MNLLGIASAAEQLAAVLERPPVTIESKRCVRARNRAAECETCVQVCPAGAISIEDGVRIDLDACVSCGACYHTCPAGVFSGRDDLRNILTCIDNLVDRDVVEVMCAPHPSTLALSARTDAVIRVEGCLASLGASAYIGMLALGAGQIIVRTDHCADCPLHDTQCAIQSAIDSAQGILAGRGEASRLLQQQDAPQPRKGANRPVHSSKNPPLSRRKFFSRFSLNGEEAIRMILPTDEGLDDAESNTPRERRRLLAGLALLPPAKQDDPLPDGLPFARLSVAEGCTACGMCGRVCPTGAIQFFKTDDRFAVSFASGACTRCGQCIMFCEPGVLQRDGTPTPSELIAAEPVVLAIGDAKRCERCGTLFVGAGTLCAPCEFRRQNPFGMRTPPSALIDPMHKKG